MTLAPWSRLHKNQWKTQIKKQCHMERRGEACVCVYIYIICIYIYIYVHNINMYVICTCTLVPVVPHKAVAEVSKNRKL